MSSPALRRERTRPRVSVIVPTRDQTAELRELLSALGAQTLPLEQFEVIVGDDGSRDTTVTRLERPDGSIRVVSGPPGNSFIARNRAAAVSSGAALAFTDADCRPHPEWLAAGLSALERADVVAGRIIPVIPLRHSAWGLLDVESFDHQRMVGGGWASTANLFVRREVFQRAGGFDERFESSSDRVFVVSCVQAGARLAFSANAVIEHPVRNSAKAFLSKLWFYNRWALTQRSYARIRATPLGAASLIPLVGELWFRRKRGMPLLLDRRQLEELGVHPTFGEHLQSLAIRYFVLPAVRSAAGLYGWKEGRRLRDS